MTVKGWKIAPEDRARLLERFPPIWPETIADHVTLKSFRGKQTTSPAADQGKIVGHVNDGKGLQALVVEIEGTTTRPDGNTYHITWSIDRKMGREPKDSNEVIARLGWDTLDHPITIGLTPASWS